MDVQSPYEFIGFGATDFQCPYEFMEFGATDTTITGTTTTTTTTTYVNDIWTCVFSLTQPETYVKRRQFEHVCKTQTIWANYQNPLSINTSTRLLTTTTTGFASHRLTLTKPYEFIRQMRTVIHTHIRKIVVHGLERYELESKLGIHGSKPYKFIEKFVLHDFKCNALTGKLGIHGSKPFEFIWKIVLHGVKHYELIGKIPATTITTSTITGTTTITSTTTIYYTLYIYILYI
jgi:hypothetical protein